jgi:hypothetical protein
MRETELFLMFTRKFDELGKPYMVSGSVAAIVYGVARLTNDIDLVAHLDLVSTRRLSELFPNAEFYCPPSEIIGLEIARARRGHFNILHIESGFKADVYLHGNDPLHVWGLARARREKMGTDYLTVAPPEYVIIRKLEYFEEGGSEKHLRDIRSILETQTATIEMADLQNLIEERGLSDAWQKAKTVSM